MSINIDPDTLVESIDTPFSRVDLAVRLMRSVIDDSSFDLFEQVVEVLSLEQREKAITAMVHAIAYTTGERRHAVRAIKAALNEHYDDEDELS